MADLDPTAARVGGTVAASPGGGARRRAATRAAAGIAGRNRRVASSFRSRETCQRIGDRRGLALGQMSPRSPHQLLAARRITARAPSPLLPRACPVGYPLAIRHSLPVGRQRQRLP
jgi:hypothetical protein